MKRFIGIGIAVAMCALTGATSAQTYSNAIGINLTKDGSAGGGAVATGSGGHIDASNPDFGYWNNLDGSGTFLSGPVDANNAAVGGGFAVNVSGVTWQLPGQIFDNGPEKVGQPWPDYNPSAQGDLAYSGVGGGGEENPTLTVTIPNIPYAAYDVAVLVGWYENAVRWHVFKGDDANTWTGQDSWVGNTFTGSIAGNTFTFNGGDGHGVYAIQILSKDAGGPGPGPTSELIGHWPFDEGSGTNAFDATTNHLNGLLLGDPLPDWTSGVFSNALQFDGSQNEVVVADAAKLTPTGALTITAWVNPASASDGFTISKWSTDGLSGSYLLWVTPTNAEFNVFLNGTQTIVTGTNALTAATWHLVAGTYNGTNLTLYVDGVLNNSIAAQGPLDVVTEPLRMGGIAGQLDDVRLYNYALTSAEIAALHDEALDPAGDADGDGIPNGWELAHGMNPNDPNDASLDSDGDGLTNLQEYQGGTDPLDYYNGVLPGLSIVSGDNQTGATGAFLPQSLVVALTDAGSAALNNAPITFHVSQGQALLAETVNNTPLNSLNLRTDASGQSAIVVLLPAQAGTNLVTVTATSGTNNTAVTFTAVAQTSTTPEGYSNSIGVNFSRGTDAAESDPHSHGAMAAGSSAGYVAQTHWNNLNVGDPGSPVYLAPTTDAQGVAVPAPTVSFTGIDWVMPTVDVYPKHGMLYPNQTQSTENTPGYIGLGDFYDGNQMSMTVSGIPYASFDVAVLEGWFENGVRWHVFKGNDPSTWSGQDGWVGNTFTGIISGNTFTFNGSDGHAVYAVQILSRDTSGTVTDVVTVNGSAVSGTLGEWQVDGADIYAVDRRGYVEYTINVPQTDMYRLQVQGRQNMEGSSVNSFDLQLFVDGERLGRQTMSATATTDGVVQAFTPYLVSGSHTFRIYWDNATSFTSLRIKTVKLQSIAGPDANNNGVKDWMDARLAQMSSVDTSTPATSHVSPVCLEGRGQYLSLMTVAAFGDSGSSTNLTVNPSPNDRWYANVPLASTTNTVITVSHQNGGLVQTRNVQWTPKNVLDGGALTIRAGDSVLLTAYTGGGAPPANGTCQLSIGGAQYSTTPNAPVAHLFASSGTFTVNATYTAPGGAQSTGSITVNVVSYTFDTGPVGRVNTQRTWDVLNVPSAVALEADTRLAMAEGSVSPTGTHTLSLTADQNEPRCIVSRIGANGPILSVTTVEGFRFWSSSQTYAQVVEENPDGSDVVEMLMVLSPVPTELTAIASVWTGGVTFEDGTINKTLTAGDFDELGQYRVRWSRAAGHANSICHHVTLKQGTVVVGGY